MKALAICGSPREKGNTEFYLRLLLDELAAKGIETEFLYLKDKEIKHCTGCYGCLTHKACVQKDDFEEVFAKMMEADAIFIGAPVYVSRPASLVSALLERVTFSARASGRMLSGKIGAPVTVARRAGQTFAGMPQLAPAASTTAPAWPADKPAPPIPTACGNDRPGHPGLCWRCASAPEQHQSSG